jgi:predicted nuclease of predicted toxin-antitoxin system
MPIRFQADADLNQIIVAAVVRRVAQVDFRTATTAGLAGLTDAEVLALAARDGRILVTHDQTTMPRHFGEFVRSTKSPGLIVVPQSLAVREVADSLILVWSATDSGEWINRMIYLPI